VERPAAIAVVALFFLGGCAGATGLAGPGAPRAAKPGLLIVCQPEDAEVYLDGTLRGRARDYDGREGVLPLGMGEHRVELRAAGYEPRRITVDTAGARQRLELALTPLGTAP
jgi:hypothetical protein